MLNGQCEGRIADTMHLNVAQALFFHSMCQRYSINEHNQVLQDLTYKNVLLRHMTQKMKRFVIKVK